MSVRVRFAPSPTGRLHVGNVRTALLNFLFAKAQKGTFILRIDDTDQERSTLEYEEGIKQDLSWLSMHWDESFNQSNRFEHYQKAAQDLKDRGLLYPCYETADELDRQRKLQRVQGRPPIYNRAALTLTQAQITAYEQEGRKPHWRFRLSGDSVSWDDKVRGQQSIETASLSDPVLIRGDGSFLYTLPSVVDDIDYNPNKQGAIQAFLDKDTDGIYNSHGLVSPRSPYQVMAGNLIPASLVTGINSDLPGQVIGQVTENVFDTVTGQHLLIPQGSRLIGRYDSVVAFGQSRALVVWTRLILPNGDSIQLDNLPGSDAQGFAGLKDKVDRHTWQFIKGAALSSLLSVGSELAADDGDRLTRALQNAGQDTANIAGQRIIDRNLNVQPTIKIRQGWRFNVIVSRDLILKPYGD